MNTIDVSEPRPVIARQPRLRVPISREELNDFDFVAAASSETETKTKISLRSEARLVILTPGFRIRSHMTADWDSGVN